MSDEEAIEHTKSITGFNYCGGCGKDWPCEVARLTTENGRLRAPLLAFIHAYANVERLDHDMLEVKLFEAWLKGCAALGIKAEPPIRRLEGSPI